MNTFRAKIISIERESSAILVKLDSAGNVFSAFMLDFDGKVRVGAECNVLFKESEVMVCDKTYERISARNRFISAIESIEEDGILARIIFRFNGDFVASLITKEAKDALGLAVGAEFAWFVKSNEIMLEFLDSTKVANGE